MDQRAGILILYTNSTWVKGIYMLIKTIKNYKSQIIFKAVALAVFIFVLGGRFFMTDQAHTAVSYPESPVKDSALQEKIEQYKIFKSTYEDKDFRLKGTPVKRTEQASDIARAYSFTVYHIAYGITEDNFREYNPYSKQIVRNPIYSGQGSSPVCRSGFFVEEHRKSASLPEVTCLDETEKSYPIDLILNTFSKKEREHVVTIYEFKDGDIDIRFSFEKGSDKKFVAGLFKKLKEADELNDARRPEAEMHPIIPTDNQRVTAVFLDEDKNGEPEFVLLPYCINGSFFDQNPHNNSFQVGLKYKLVTKKDLAGKPDAERIALEDRLGLWKWDKPSEILASFSENPGPDIVFYDIGKVVNSVVVDERPDGKFDRYEFLY
jgi:hypothetical protein